MSASSASVPVAMWRVRPLNGSRIRRASRVGSAGDTLPSSGSSSSRRSRPRVSTVWTVVERALAAVRARRPAAAQRRRRRGPESPVRRFGLWRDSREQQQADARRQPPGDAVGALHARVHGGPFYVQTACRGQVPETHIGFLRLQSPEIGDPGRKPHSGMNRSLPGSDPATTMIAARGHQTTNDQTLTLRVPTPPAPKAAWLIVGAGTPGERRIEIGETPTTIGSDAGGAAVRRRSACVAPPCRGRARGCEHRRSRSAEPQRHVRRRHRGQGSDPRCASDDPRRRHGDPVRDRGPGASRNADGQRRRLVAADAGGVRSARAARAVGSDDHAARRDRRRQGRARARDPRRERAARGAVRRVRLRRG